MNHSTGRVVFAGLVAGVVLNVLGWVGHQFLLGDLWTGVLASPPKQRLQRSVANELVTLLPSSFTGWLRRGSMT